jgi:hypothetical protein
MAGKFSHLIKSVAARVSRQVLKRRRVLRLGVRFEARLPFLVTLLGTERGFVKGQPDDNPALVGFTRNLSETGMTLLLPSVRIGNAYLTNVESYLEVKLELPGGAVAIRTASVRFEQLPRREAGCGYLLAVRIVNMQNDDRDRYVAYLKSLGSKKHGAVKLARAHAVANGLSSMTQTGNWEDPTPASVSKAFEQFVRE